MSSPSLPNVTSEGIFEGLRKLGVAAGETIFVHSSLRAFGHVEGGAEAVVEALLSSVDPDGHVVMPTFTWDAFHAAHGVVFDPSSTPSETGRITEVFRRRSGVLRSLHLCHSVAACGPRATDFVADAPSVHGEGGTFEALLRANAWNLFLGVGFTSCTALHTVEERARVPYRAFRDFLDCSVREPDGALRPSRSVEFLRLPGYRNDFGKMEAIFCERGVLREARIGAARVMMVRLRDVVKIAGQLLEKDPFFLLTAESRPRVP